MITSNPNLLGQPQAILAVGSGDWLGSVLSGIANHLRQKADELLLAYGNIKNPNAWASHILALILASLNILICQAGICSPCLRESGASPAWNVLHNIQAGFGDVIHGTTIQLNQSAIAGNGDVKQLKLLNVAADKQSELTSSRTNLTMNNKDVSPISNDKSGNWERAYYELEPIICMLTFLAGWCAYGWWHSRSLTLPNEKS
jgi:hypothetical protein